MYYRREFPLQKQKSLVGNLGGIDFVYILTNLEKNNIFNAFVKKIKLITNTAREENKEASCLFPSLTFWNSEEFSETLVLKEKEKKGMKVQ